MKKSFYGLSNDIIFKNTFNTDDALKRLLEETLNINVNKIRKNSTELSVESKNERRKYLDLILKTDRGIIDVEVNHGYKEELPNRNLLYFCKLISSSVLKNKSYTNVDKHIQLNISWNLNKYLNFNIENRKIITCHISDDKSHNKVNDDIFEIVHINMDYFIDVWYHGDKRKENPFLMLLAAESKKQMDEICKGDKLMERLNDKVNDLNKDPDVLDVIIENEEEIIEKSLFEKGVKTGIQKGIYDTAKNLLNMNMPVDDISRATGLSKSVIEKIKWYLNKPHKNNVRF